MRLANSGSANNLPIPQSTNLPIVRQFGYSHAVIVVAVAVVAAVAHIEVEIALQTIGQQRLRRHVHTAALRENLRGRAARGADAAPAAAASPPPIAAPRMAPSRAPPPT